MGSQCRRILVRHGLSGAGYIYSIIWYEQGFHLYPFDERHLVIIGVSYGCLSGVASGVIGQHAMMQAVELLQGVSRSFCPCC